MRAYKDSVIESGYIYLITYPNGKIYIGQDRTNDINYFGSANSYLIERDFTKEEMMDFAVRRQIIQRFERLPISEINKIEKEMILKYKSNEPNIGYNKNPLNKKYGKKRQNIIK